VAVGADRRGPGPARCQELLRRRSKHEGPVLEAGRNRQQAAAGSKATRPFKHSSEKGQWRSSWAAELRARLQAALFRRNPSAKVGALGSEPMPEEPGCPSNRRLKAQTVCPPAAGRAAKLRAARRAPDRAAGAPSAAAAIPTGAPSRCCRAGQSAAKRRDRRRHRIAGKPKKGLLPPSWPKAKGRPGRQGTNLPKSPLRVSANSADPIGVARPKRHRCSQHQGGCRQLAERLPQQGRINRPPRRSAHHHPQPGAGKASKTPVCLSQICRGPGQPAATTHQPLIKAHPGPRAQTPELGTPQLARRPRSAGPKAVTTGQQLFARPRPPHRRRGTRGCRPNSPLQGQSLCAAASPLPGAGQPLPPAPGATPAGPRPGSGRR